MEETSEKIEDKKQEIKDKVMNWIKDPNNIILAGIIILTIIIRLYYFSLTKNQPLWWDEADYLAYSKNLAGLSTHWIVTDAHSSLFPFLVAFFFKLGFSEVLTKFILTILPSILVVFLVYKISILLYKDKKIALISAFLMATFWNVLFNAMRFHVGGPAIFFGFLAIYVFFQGYENKKKIFGKLNHQWALPLTALFVILTYGLRRGYFVFGFFFLFYLIFTKKLKDLKSEFKSKYFWIAIAIFGFIFFLFEKFVFATSGGSIGDVVGNYIFVGRKFNLIPFQIFRVFFSNIFNPTLSPLFYLFYLGLILILINLFFYLGHIKKSQNKEVKSDIFTLVMVFTVLGYFLFIQRRIDYLGDPRWYSPLLFGAFICISKGALFITNYIKKYNKAFAIIVIFLLVGYGGYYEVQHADMIIKNKIPSFNGIKGAGLFLKEISQPEDVVIVVPKPQLAYYAERETSALAEQATTEQRRAGNFGQEEDLIKFLEDLKKEENKKLKYIVVSFSEPNHPLWMRRDSPGKIEIPFMDSYVDTTGNNNHVIQASKSYDEITFNLLKIVEESFVYEIVRNTSYTLPLEI